MWPFRCKPDPQNWFASAEALRWMLLMLCWSDYEAAVVFDIGWEDLQIMLSGAYPVPSRIWCVYMPLATILRDQMLDTGYWPFPELTPIPVGRMPDAPFVQA